MSVEITVFDGANTIGGSKIHLLAGDVGLFLDFGMDFKKYGLYFEEFLQPRSVRGIYDLLTLKLIPPLENIYRGDLLPTDLKIESGIRPKVDAVFLSHAHMDHCGNVGLLDEYLPIYCSSMTAVICKAMQDSGQSSFAGEVVYTAPRAPVKDSPLAIGAQRGASCKGRQIYIVDHFELARLKEFWETTYSSKKLEPVFPSEAAGRVGGINFKAFASDHSIFGATCYAFESNVGWIAYTGDFRLHGARGNLSRTCVEELAKLELRALIVEGTNIKEKRKADEDEVFTNSLREVKGASGEIVIADFGPRNIDRLLTFLKIAQETDRKLIITTKDAFLLHAMRLASNSIPNVLVDPHLYIFDEIRASRNLWERDFIRALYGGKYVKASEIQKNQENFILAFSFWDLKHLLDVMPKGGIYIYSTSEAFTEEQEIDIQRLKNWLDFFNIRPVGFEISGGEIKFLPGYHASGHISGEELIRVLKEIRPECVIPVHTEHPELFVECLGKDTKVILPKEGVSMSL